MDANALPTIDAVFQARLDRLQIVPRLDVLKELVSEWRSPSTGYRVDEQLAPIWAEKLRHTFTEVLEVEYTDLDAAEGNVLPIDSSVSPESLIWEYYRVDQTGFAAWIDDDGKVMPSGAIKAKRFTGEMHEFGHKYEWTVFDLERAAAVNLPLSSMKAENARRAHAEFVNWVWLFGDSGKNLLGLVTHPNITVSLAPLRSGGSVDADRLWSLKSNDEILTDLATLIDTVPQQTGRKEHVATVFMSLKDAQILRRRRLGAGDGTLTLWDFVQTLWKGDDTGQPKVSFRVLNECDPTYRVQPGVGSDTSGITGRFLLAIPAANKSKLAFIRARPFTQRPPQERDFVLYHTTHEKIGGCKCQVPLAVHRMDFRATA